MWNMKIKRRCFRYIAAVLVMGFMFAGCDKKEMTETEPFHIEEICSLSQLQEESGISQGAILAEAGRNDNAYVVLESYEEEDTEWLFYQVQEEGVSQTFSMEVTEDDDVKAFDVDSKGNYYLLKNEYGETEQVTLLVRIDSAKKETREVSLDDRLSEYDTVQNLQLDQRDNIYLFFESGKISVFSADMEWQYDITDHEEEYILDVARCTDGAVIFASARYEGDKEVLKIYQIDRNAKNSVEIMKLEGDQYFSDILINGTKQYDYYVRGQRKISGGKMGKKRLTPML